MNCNRLDWPNGALKPHQCRYRARYFGQWSGGGLCEHHMLDLVKDYGIHILHPQYREEAARLLAESGAPPTVKAPDRSPGPAS